MTFLAGPRWPWLWAILKMQLYYTLQVGKFIGTQHRNKLFLHCKKCTQLHAAYLFRQIQRQIQINIQNTNTNTETNTEITRIHFSTGAARSAVLSWMLHISSVKYIQIQMQIQIQNTDTNTNMKYKIQIQIQYKNQYKIEGAEQLCTQLHDAHLFRQIQIQTQLQNTEYRIQIRTQRNFSAAAAVQEMYSDACYLFRPSFNLSPVGPLGWPKLASTCRVLIILLANYYHPITIIQLFNYPII